MENARKIMTPEEYKKLTELKASLPTWAQVDEGGVFNYVVIKIKNGNDNMFVAVDDDSLKIDLSPLGVLMNALRYDPSAKNKLRKLDAEKDEATGLYLLKGQIQKSSGKSINYGMLAVPLSEILGIEEKIDLNKAHYVLVQRSKSGINKRVTDASGQERSLNYCIALIAGEEPLFKEFEEPQRVPSIGSCPGIAQSKDGKVTASILDLESALSGFTETFITKHPELSRYYPFSPDFRYAEKNGF
jgi:hypothetical protein